MDVLPTVPVLDYQTDHSVSKLLRCVKVLLDLPISGVGVGHHNRAIPKLKKVMELLEALKVGLVQLLLTLYILPIFHEEIISTANVAWWCQLGSQSALACSRHPTENINDLTHLSHP